MKKTMALHDMLPKLQIQYKACRSAHRISVGSEVCRMISKAGNRSLEENEEEDNVDDEKDNGKSISII